MQSHCRLPICLMWAYPERKKTVKSGSTGVKTIADIIALKPLDGFISFGSSMELSSPVVVQSHGICPFVQYGFAHGNASLKSSNVFWPFEFLWNCPDLHLHNIMVVCLFAHYKLAHVPNNGPIRNCCKFQPLGPVMINELRGIVGLRMHSDKHFQYRSNYFSQNCERKVAWIWIYVVDYVLTANIYMRGTWKKKHVSRQAKQ